MTFEVPLLLSVQRVYGVGGDVHRAMRKVARALYTAMLETLGRVLQHALRLLARDATPDGKTTL
jgi:hypothetical protein